MGNLDLSRFKLAVTLYVVIFKLRQTQLGLKNI